MQITKEMTHARIGGCIELTPTTLRQRRLVRKRGPVPDDVIQAAMKNVPDSATYKNAWIWMDNDGDGHLLIVWKENNAS